MEVRVKKVVSMILSSALLVTGLAGCGSTSTSSASAGSTSSSSGTANVNVASTTGGTAATGDLSVTISHQPYSHALPTYIGLQEGDFEKNGLDINVLWFTSGNTQNEALGANEWDAGACGTPPAIAAGVAYDAKIIGLNVDDTISCDYWVRPDSDIAQITGEIEGHPDIMGNADTWKGKTILCPTQTSAH